MESRRLRDQRNIERGSKSTEVHMRKHISALAALGAALSLAAFVPAADAAHVGGGGGFSAGGHGGGGFSGGGHAGGGFAARGGSFGGSRMARNFGGGHHGGWHGGHGGHWRGGGWYGWGPAIYFGDPYYDDYYDYDYDYADCYWRHGRRFCRY
ncbi:hypothetical protein HYPDE_41428 [Hyphomicrobium denitrificans 1NES1]|uniref:Uncharacterized protein n=2 Tax=Hyphomicrobium denitrificans TaxID=53399 RepID=N0B8L5_9HYPH|nr:hypothetical protein HYPDE_41428 [Hyphomicrobium denitrificans 1NES1]